MSKTFQVLKKLLNMFKEENIFYVLGGHTGLIVHGVDIDDDREIDICTNKEGAYKIQKLLNDKTEKGVSYKELKWFKAHWGVFKLGEVTIEVMGEPKRKLEDGSWRGLLKQNITTTKFGGDKINVFTLESEYEYYDKSSFNKPKHKKVAEKIKKLL